MLTSQPCTANQQSPGTLTTNSRRTAAKSVREIHTNSIDSERKSEKFRGITKHQSMVKNFAAETAHSGAIVRGPLQWLPQEYSRIPCSRQSQTSPPLSRLRQAAPHAPKPIAQFACPNASNREFCPGPKFIEELPAITRISPRCTQPPNLRLLVDPAVGKSAGIAIVTAPVAAHSVPRSKVVMNPTHSCEYSA